MRDLFILTLDTLYTNMQVLTPSVAAYFWTTSKQNFPPHKCRTGQCIGMGSMWTNFRFNYFVLYDIDNLWCTKNKSFPSTDNDWTDTCGCNLQEEPTSWSQTEVKSTDRHDNFRVDCWQKKSQKKEPSAVNHIPNTKLSQLYSTEKTSDQSSLSSCLDREGTSSLTSQELDTESGAP